MGQPLSRQQLLFVEAYNGDLLEAMQVAGYNGPPGQLKSRGDKLLNNPKIVAAINDRSQYSDKMKKVIADREERQSFWTDIMRNKDPHAIEEVDKSGMSKPPENLPLATRLKASEMLGKSEADFMDRVDVSGNISVTDIIAETYELSEEEYELFEAQELAKLKDNSDTPAPPKNLEQIENSTDVDDLI